MISSDLFFISKGELMKNMIFTAILVLLISCGKDDEKSEVSITSLSDLEGTWVSECFETEGNFDSIEVTLKGESRSIVTIDFGSDDNCKEDRFVVVAESTFSIVGESATIPNAIDVDNKISEASIELKSSEVADALNTEPATCGKDDWEADKEYDYLGICDIKPEVYSTNLLQDGELYFAKASDERDGESEDSRMINMQYDRPFTKQE